VRKKGKKSRKIVELDPSFWGGSIRTNKSLGEYHNLFNSEALKKKGRGKVGKVGAVEGRHFL